MNDLKVKFKELERLELTDINAIQDIAEAIRDDYAGNLFGAEGALTKLSFQEPILNNQIQFNDFAFLGKKEITSTGNLNRAFLGVYDASKSTDTFNIDASDKVSNAQNYFNLNNNEPTIGGTGLAVHFPFIWVAAFNADSAVATRRVWSLSDAQEQTDSIETRVERRFKFKLSINKPDDENLHTPYVKIGQIWKYAVSNNVVSIDEIRTYFVSEDLLGIGDVHPNTIINSYDSLKEYQGLKHTLHLIKDFLEKQLTNGSNDPANTTTKSLVEQPTYSLQGLTAKVTNTVRISAHINIQAEVNNTSESTIVTVTTEHPEHTNSDGWDEFEAVYINYKYMKDQLGGFTAATFQTVAHNNISDYTNWLLRLSLFSIQVPEKYLDKPYKVTFTPSFEINPGLGNATEEVDTYKHLKTYKVQHVSDFATTEQSLKISPEKRTQLDNSSTGETSEVNFTGIHFLISDLDEFFIQRDASGVITNPESRDFNIRVDMEIYQ